MPEAESGEDVVRLVLARVDRNLRRLIADRRELRHLRIGERHVDIGELHVSRRGADLPTHHVDRAAEAGPAAEATIRWKIA